MVNIEIRCPSCSKRGFLNVQEEIINQSSRGVTAVNVAKDQICSHSFVAYIDKNLAVRDCFMTDFQIELPQIAPEIREDREIPGLDTVDVDIIKLNLHALTLTSIIRACLFKQDVLVISETFLNEHFRKFFEFIFRNSFKVDLNFKTKEDYKKEKKQYKRHIIFDGNKVLNDKKKILDPKKIKVERTIVQRFLAEYDSKSSLIIIKNQLMRTYELAEEIIDLIKTHDGDEKIGKKRLIDQLFEKKAIKVTFSYLEFLLNILKNYFEFDLSVLSDYYFPAFGI